MAFTKLTLSISAGDKVDVPDSEAKAQAGFRFTVDGIGAPVDVALSAVKADGGYSAEFSFAFTAGQVLNASVVATDVTGATVRAAISLTVTVPDEAAVTSSFVLPSGLTATFA